MVKDWWNSDPDKTQPGNLTLKLCDTTVLSFQSFFFWLFLYQATASKLIYPAIRQQSGQDI
jgi:hypothetical protein